MLNEAKLPRLRTRPRSEL